MFRKFTTQLELVDVIFKDSCACKTDCVFPDIVLTDQFMVFTAVNDCQSTLCEIMSGVASILFSQ